jgi:hypothetical protein
MHCRESGDAGNARTGKVLWETNLGTLEEIAPLGIALRAGTPSFGGPLVTRGGLVFIGATFEWYLRQHGEHVRWRGEVVGWVVNHRFDPKTLRFTCSYLRDELCGVSGVPEPQLIISLLLRIITFTR